MQQAASILNGIVAVAENYNRCIAEILLKRRIDARCQRRGNHHVNQEEKVIMCSKKLRFLYHGICTRLAQVHCKEALRQRCQRGEKSPCHDSGRGRLAVCNRSCQHSRRGPERQHHRASQLSVPISKMHVCLASACCAVHAVCVHANRRLRGPSD